VAGYSGAPLAKKLGIKEGSTLAFHSAPDGFAETLGDLPAGVEIRRTTRGTRDLVVAFFTRRASLERRIGGLGDAVFPAGSLWIAWPKRAAGVTTDVTEGVVREVALPLGLVDNKVCAIDETWSGLRLVWRLERRSDGR
jgi:hypothetical protein